MYEELSFKDILICVVSVVDISGCSCWSLVTCVDELLSIQYNINLFDFSHLLYDSLICLHLAVAVGHLVTCMYSIRFCYTFPMQYVCFSLESLRCSCCSNEY